MSSSNKSKTQEGQQHYQQQQQQQHNRRRENNCTYLTKKIIVNEFVMLLLLSLWVTLFNTVSATGGFDLTCYWRKGWNQNGRTTKLIGWFTRVRGGDYLSPENSSDLYETVITNNTCNGRDDERLNNKTTGYNANPSLSLFRCNDNDIIISTDENDNTIPPLQKRNQQGQRVVEAQEVDDENLEKQPVNYTPKYISQFDNDLLYVTKRDGRRELFNSTKIFNRLQSLTSSYYLDNDNNFNYKNERQTMMVSILKHVNISSLCETIIRGMYNNVSTYEIDVLAAESAASLCTHHFEYATLAARILITLNHKMTPKSFSSAMKLLYKTSAGTPTITKTHDHHDDDINNNYYQSTSDDDNYLHPDLIDLIERRGHEIDEQIHHERDFDLTYFGFKTLERAYLLRNNFGTMNSQNTENNNNNKDYLLIERPQYMFMRTALGIHCTGPNQHNHNRTSDEEDIMLHAAYETYECMSRGIFTHASPTLFHSGTAHQQLASCFLVQMSEDSIVGIYDTLKQCAVISKSAGGIGLSCSKIRARGTPIRGTRGVSNGLVPMLRVYDVTSRYVDQGGGKRPGAFAIYLEPWHSDIFDVLNLKKNHGKEEQRARDLFYGLWIPDLFMKRVQEDSVWSLMCPHQCPGLSDCYGSDFEELYQRYEQENRYIRQVRARELWAQILESQIETGTPYMLYKDACNTKSNQKNLGTIQCSNLCTEIIQYTSPNEVAVCNLASICLSKFVVSDRGPFGSVNPYSSSNRAYFDHDALYRATKIVTRNLNKIIDINDYPLPESRKSNLSHRPIGIGVSGLADAFLRLGLPFTSEAARLLNAAIFETMYHAALEASAELAIECGPYETFEGSPASKGLIQFDLWDNSGSSQDQLDETTPSHQFLKQLVDKTYKDKGLSPPIARQRYPESVEKNGGYDWCGIRKKIMQTGLRNSLLLAPMPTASTSQILGVNECFEPFSSNLYIRRVKAGEFIMANPHLIQDLTDNGLWTQSVRNQLKLNGGSIQKIPEMPDRIKELYKTVWEIKMKDIIDMAADRGRFIDQSQSMNLFLADPTVDKLNTMHFYAWRKGLKTGMYYLRTKAAVNAIQYTVDSTPSLSQEDIHCIPDAERDDICLSCQS